MGEGGGRGMWIGSLGISITCKFGISVESRGERRDEFTDVFWQDGRKSYIQRQP